MSIGGGSPLHTAAVFVAGPASNAISREWGESIWTAPELAQRAFNEELRKRQLGFLFGVRL